MTPKEIENVRAAWEAAPECRVFAGENATLCSLAWFDGNQVVSARWRWKWIHGEGWVCGILPMDDDVPPLIRDALHRRLLALDCAVHQDGAEFYIIRKNWSKPVIVRCDSLISAMALAIVTLSKGSPHAQA